MDESRRRALLGASSLGKAIVKDEDRANEGAYQQAAADVRARHPVSEDRRQHFLRSSHLGKAVLRDEQEQQAQHATRQGPGRHPDTGRFVPAGRG